jgi:hypothetical protein
VLVAAKLLRHNRSVKTLRLCDNHPATVVGVSKGSAYPRSGLGDLARTLTPPLQGLPGAALSVVGRRPPRGLERRRGPGLDLAMDAPPPWGGGGGGGGGDADPWFFVREGRPPLFEARAWHTACRPELVDLSNCGIVTLSQGASSGAGGADPDSPLGLLTPVLRGLYCWGLEHAAAPDSLVLLRKDALPKLDAALRGATAPPERLTSPYSPHHKARSLRGGVRHLNAIWEPSPSA